MSKRILLVDDEPNVLQGFKRHLRKRYDIEIAVGGHNAVEAFKTNGPFAVVVSDMQMPEMTGVQLFARLKKIDDQAVRMMLTGNADQQTAIDACNEASIFRFLNKPCPPDELAESLDAALEHYRLITAEAELLSKTVSGSIRMLTEVLSLAMPDAFGAAIETRKLARSVAEKMGVGPLWQIDMAAMLLRLGCVSLPAKLLKDYLNGENLSAADQRLIDEHPNVGARLVSSIPRLDPIAEMIRQHQLPASDDVPLAAQILKVVSDYQLFRQSNIRTAPLQRLQDSDAYNQEVVSTLAEALSLNSIIREATVRELRDGMVLEQNVLNGNGDLLIKKGSEIHEAMIQRLHSFQKSEQGVREPIFVRVPQLNA